MALNDSVLCSLAARMAALPFTLESDDIEDDLTTIADDEYEHMIDALEAHILHVEDRLNDLFVATGHSPPSKPKPAPPEEPVAPPKPKCTPAPFAPQRVEYKNEDYERILEERTPTKSKARGPPDTEARRLEHAEEVLRELAGLQRQVKAARAQALREKVIKQRRRMAALEERRVKREQAERERTREIAAQAKAKASVPPPSNTDFLASLPKSTFYVALQEERRGKKTGLSPHRAAAAPSPSLTAATLLADVDEETNSWALTAAPEKDAQAALELIKSASTTQARAMSAPQRTALMALLGPPPAPPRVAPRARLSTVAGMQRTLLLMLGAAKRNTDLANTLLADRLAGLGPGTPDSNAVLRVLPGELVAALRTRMDALARPSPPRAPAGDGSSGTRSPRLVSSMGTPSATTLATQRSTPRRRTAREPLPPITPQAPAPAFDYYGDSQAAAPATAAPAPPPAPLTIDALQAASVCIKPTPTQTFFTLPL
eukprot:m.39505 g.39505  ORF g.39505 m.39505 type:complete len:488 (+) comp10157_c0_seq1:85-1548(+)